MKFKGIQWYKMKYICLLLVVIGAITGIHSIAAKPVKYSSSIKKPIYYPGISPKQDSIVQLIIHHFHNFKWKKSNQLIQKLQSIEKREGLPPLSYLISVSSRVLRVQNGEFTNKRVESKLLDEIKKFSKKGIRLCDNENIPDTIKPTYGFIKGGILGYTATLKIQSNPLGALSDGLYALKILENVKDKEPDIKDVYLGLGLFNCLLAKKQKILKICLRLFGISASFETGLDYLRICAHEGRYTTTAAQLYLIQFLSPYYGHLTKEKYSLLESLQKKYPTNPYYLFIELEESLCFHPRRFYSFSTRGKVEKSIPLFSEKAFSLRRYLNLVRWQYWAINPFASKELSPDRKFKFREFSFYPVFIQAVKQKHLLSAGLPSIDKAQKLQVRLIKELEKEASALLDKSKIKITWKGFYQWHIRDALRME